ncbi:MAG: MerR family transcriptional regulator [Acidobacteriota bacterium]|nr:MerR family transcriptional regulator [Acidobacteriota bacterium]
MFPIGQFSKMTRLSVKALRHYHDLGLLAPDKIDPDSGYRYYKTSSLERARVIVSLKDLGFPLEEIGTILADCREDTDLLQFLETRHQDLETRLAELQARKHALEGLISTARQSREQVRLRMDEVVEKDLDPMLFAGVRMKGGYGEIGKAFSRVGRKAGFKIAGKPLGLFYDEGYRETDADFEGGFPLRKPIDDEVVDCRELEGGHAVSLIHNGPYSDCGPTYQALLTHIAEKGYTPQSPSREVYLKGPGMIFKGNPARYITEIQLLVE